MRSPGGPELVEWVWRGLTQATPLRPEERAAGAEALGETAIRWRDVRVAERGLLSAVFRRNGNRAFTLFHTVNLPQTGAHTRSNVAILVHELLHVFQYERCGSAYIPQALYAQQRGEGYDYGRSNGLVDAQAHGKRFCDFNREQQGQIIQDYYALLHLAAEAEDAGRAAEVRGMLACYEPFVQQARSGDL